MVYRLRIYVWGAYQIGEACFLFVDLSSALALFCHLIMEFSRMCRLSSIPIEQEDHFMQDLVKIAKWVVNILHRHLLRVGVTVLLTRKSPVEPPWFLLALDFYTWCVRFLVNHFDLIEEVTSKLESVLWMKLVDEIVGLRRKIGFMILMHLGLLVWLLVKFSQRLSDLAKLRY
jgi:hypothetical protein